MNDALTHFGILGMKWGVRRTKNQLAERRQSSKNNLGNAKINDDYTSAHISKGVEYMSNSELKEKINRLQMEKQLSQLTNNEKSAGAKFVQSILTDVAKQTIVKYATKYVSKGVDTLIKSVTNDSQK